jgi:hypothetical protein
MTRKPKINPGHFSVENPGQFRAKINSHQE